MHHVVVYDDASKQLISLEKLEMPSLPIPNPFKDRLSFMSWDDLKRLSKRPEAFDSVRQKKEDLARTMATEQTLRLMEHALTATPDTPMILRASGVDDHFEIVAPSVERVKNQLLLGARGGRPVVITTFSRGRAWRRYESQRAALGLGFDEGSPEPRVSIELHDVMVFDARTTLPGADQEHLTLPRGWFTRSVYAPLAQASTDDLLRQARIAYPDSPNVTRVAGVLANEELRLGRKIVGKVYERAASAVSCVLVLALGALISMKLRGGMTLVVYFWSFLLATISVIIARGGENVIGDLGHAILVGKIIVWSGDLLLLAAIAFTYRRLSRN
jgi:hypothetical protein